LEGGTLRHDTRPGGFGLRRSPSLTRLLIAAAIAAIVALLPPSLAAPPIALALSNASFSYTGGEQDFVVPAGVTSVTVTAKGAQGGNDGGKGGTTTATIPGHAR